MNYILTTTSELEVLIQNSLRKIINESKANLPNENEELFTIDGASKFLNLAKQTLYGFTSKNLVKRTTLVDDISYASLNMV